MKCVFFSRLISFRIIIEKVCHFLSSDLHFIHFFHKTQKKHKISTSNKWILCVACKGGFCHRNTIVVCLHQGYTVLINWEPKSYHHASLCSMSFFNSVQSFFQCFFHWFLWKNKTCFWGLLYISKPASTTELTIRSWNLCHFSKVKQQLLSKLCKL